MRRAASLLAAASLVVLGATAASARPLRIAFVYSDGNMPGTLKAYKALLAERPGLRGQITIGFVTESVFDATAPADASSADVLVLDVMNQQLLDRFNAAHKTDLIAAIRTHGTVFAVGEGLLPKEHYVKQGCLWDERARAYWTHSGFANQLALLKYVLAHAGVSGLQIPDPQPSLDFGYYYPDGSSGRLFASWTDFDTWRRAHGKLRPRAPRVAIGFYKSTYYTGDTELLDALIASVESHGAEAIPMFGYPGELASARLLIDEAGNRRADVALSFLLNFADTDAWKALARVDIPVVNLVGLYGRTEAEWRSSNSGMSLFEGTFQMAVPELAGTTAPTIVGSKEKVRDPDTGLTIVVSHPIASRVATAVERGLHYAALRLKDNREKHVALVYYDYPPGKANIGASYLNVAESIANILQRLANEGYDLGGADLSPSRILEEITTKGRNVGGYAPGELADLVRHGGAVRVPLTDYRAWLGALAPQLRAKVLKDWGPVERTTLMADAGGIVIPAIRFGNVLLMPQPARGWGEDTDKLYHAKDLAPHHQYVAAYAWLRNGFKADAIVHVGTHGTLEWLDGKDAGLSEEDAPDALIADVPDLYVYNVDVVGEGLVARRRGMATLIDHMVPPFKKGGLYAELAALSETINDYEANQSKNAELATALRSRIRDQVVSLGIAKDLGLQLTSDAGLDEATLHRVENHLLELKGQNIPYGLHAFGRVPEKALRDTTIEAVVGADRSLLPQNAEVLASEMETRIVASGARELDNLLHALGGGFVPAGSGGEPIRNPDSYPTGKNFYGVDPDKVPKPASWALGVKLADQMLADHVKAHGAYPEKVSFVIWGDETMRHEGVLESQIFHLLGTKPVWNDRGKVVDVQVIPSAQLGRPRVDIVIASAAEGMFHNVTALMDKAVQRVKAIEEADNVVRRHYLQTKAALMRAGYAEKDADARAGVRIFDEPPGVFNLNTSAIAAASGTWDSDKGMADDYIRKLGHGYGNGFWGEPMPDVFRLALSGTNKVVHSSSTMLYGALDNDDMFMYVGGLAAAVRSVDGATPEIVVTNTRDPGHPEMTSMDKFIGTEFRSRYINPTWIEGMKKEGYAGAGAMREFVEYLWGWKATVPDLVDDAMWKETFDVYVRDSRKLGMKAFFEAASPFAYQDITARMVETIRKGYWKADAGTKKTLLNEFVASVNAHGSSGAEFTAGNPRLMKYVLEQGKAAGVPVPALDAFQKAMERSMGETVPAAATTAERAAAANESVPAAGAAKASQPVKGFVMEQQDRSREKSARLSRQLLQSAPTWAPLAIVVPVFALLVAWRRRHRRR
ncbi:MAG TPA: cobaltochelatase subunit CobN [Vicinamibacterales bacterium]|nr:cobaltochelatase subunit CobN [Vicinamibacterales bacterium]